MLEVPPVGKIDYIRRASIDTVIRMKKNWSRSRTVAKYSIILLLYRSVRIKCKNSVLQHTGCSIKIE